MHDVQSILSGEALAISDAGFQQALFDMTARLEADPADRKKFEPTPTEFAEGANGVVAVIPISGPIVQHETTLSRLFGWSSLTGIARQIDESIRSPGVKAIVLSVDSSGGSVYGVPELSKKIFKARSKKPIIAVAAPTMLSAAYWIGSAASEVVVQPSGDVGSIGVVVVHSESSKLDEKIGVKHSIIKAGRHKAAAMPISPLSSTARDLIQARVDLIYDEFVKDVARNRRTTVEKVRAGYGEGWMLRGAEAVKAGLADRVETLDQVIERLTGGGRKRKGPRKN